jgi:hypothetical protein
VGTAGTSAVDLPAARRPRRRAGRWSTSAAARSAAAPTWVVGPFGTGPDSSRSASPASPADPHAAAARQRQGRVGGHPRPAAPRPDPGGLPRPGPPPRPGPRRPRPRAGGDQVPWPPPRRRSARRPSRRAAPRRSGR